MPAKSKKQKKQELLGKEVIELIINRSGVTKKDIYDTSIHNFCRNNLDLLTDYEKRKYASVIL